MHHSRVTVTSGSSSSTRDTPGNEGHKGVPENGYSNKHGAPHGLGSKFCTKTSKLGPHKQHTLNCDNETGGNTEIEAEEGSDNVSTQPAIVAIVASMDGDLKVGAEPRNSKDTDKRDIRSDSPGPREDTSDDEGYEDTDEKSTVPDSSRHAGVRKDKESKHCNVKGPSERTCQETYLNKGQNATTPELRTWAPPAEPKTEIRFAYDDIKVNYIKNDTSHYEYYEITKTEYQISLLPQVRVCNPSLRHHPKTMNNKTRENSNTASPFPD